MSDPLQSVSAGDPPPLRADTWNAVLEAARDFRGNRRGTTGAANTRDPLVPACMVWVRNDTYSTLPEFSILKLSTPVISAVDFPLDVRRSPVFSGVAPIADTDIFAIMIEPAAAGGIVRAAAMGVMVCDLNVIDTTHTYAKPAVGVTATLASAASGSAKIIWKDSGTGTKRAVVLIQDAACASATGAEYGDQSDVCEDDWQDSEINVTLPAAGTYLLVAQVTMQASWASASPYTPPVAYIAYARLYDATAATAVPRATATTLHLSPGSSGSTVDLGTGWTGVSTSWNDYRTVYITTIYTVTIETVIRIEGKRQPNVNSPGWYNSGFVLFNGDGADKAESTSLSYVQLCTSSAIVETYGGGVTCLDSATGTGAGGEGGGEHWIDMGGSVSLLMSSGTSTCTCLNALGSTLAQSSSVRWDGIVNDSGCPSGDVADAVALAWTASGWKLLGPTGGGDATFVSQDDGTKTIVIIAHGVEGVGGAVCTGDITCTFVGS